GRGGGPERFSGEGEESIEADGLKSLVGSHPTRRGAEGAARSRIIEQRRGSAVRFVEGIDLERGVGAWLRSSNEEEQTLHEEKSPQRDRDRQHRRAGEKAGKNQTPCKQGDPGGDGARAPPGVGEGGGHA